MIVRICSLSALVLSACFLTQCGPTSIESDDEIVVHSDARFLSFELQSLPTEDCDNGIDDNGDQFYDCQDVECITDDFCMDRDLDFYSPSNGDCDDDDPLVNPGAFEVCRNNVDENCNGATDEGCVYENDCNNGTDDDDDTFIDCLDSDCEGSDFCIDADGDEYSLGEGDCDDNDYFINPGALEACYNGVDDNCDGHVDEQCYPEYDCENGLDDDLDGIIDCLDSDCFGSSFCGDAR